MVERQHSLVVSRTFHATPEQLYRAWTDLDVMRRWMGRRVEADVRVGGGYRREVEAGEAGVFVHVGQYEELVPNRRIVQSFGLEGVAENPFLDEQIAVILEPSSATETELVLIDRWNGPPLSAREEQEALAAWDEWLGGIEGALEGEGE